MGDNKGCLISQYKDENSGENQYTRACSGRDSYECADYPGGEGGDYPSLGFMYYIITE